MILMIDNFDSFTYNLVQYLGEMGCELNIKRNDEITLDEIAELAPKKIIVSPARVHPTKRGFPSKPFNDSAGKFRFWACVWAIRRLARRWAATLSAPKL
jgi:anthranilate/para-aminobenzoate synthase component II